MRKDKRHFRRYPSGLESTITLKGKTLKVSLLDYSLQGIGVIIDDPAVLQDQDLSECDFQTPFISGHGKVVWVNHAGEQLRGGIKISGCLKGFIKDFRISDTLLGIQRTGKTGILTLRSGDIAKDVYFRNGDIIFASSNQDEDRLSDMLLREGMITQEHYADSVAEMKRTGQRFGQVLVRLGYLNHSELFSAVRRQAEEIILSLFTFQDGPLVFLEQPLPSEEVITLRMAAATLTYRGIKRIDNFSMLKHELPSMDSIIHFSSDPIDLFQDISLDEAGKKILSCINNKATARDIIESSNLDRVEALKTLGALISARIVSVDQVTDVPDEIINETVREGIGSTADSAHRYKIEQMFEKYERLGYYGVLGIQDSVSLPEIKNAYYRAAKAFHPDVHFHQIDDSTKHKLDEIFSYINEAYATLSNPDKRKEYDRKIYIKPYRKYRNR